MARRPGDQGRQADHARAPLGRIFPSRPTWLCGLLAGLLHSALMWMAFPPLGLWPAALVAVLPLALLAGWGRGGRENGRWGGGGVVGMWAAVGVVPLWTYEQWFIKSMTVLAYPPMVLALAGFTWLFVWTLGRTRWRLSLAVPVLWVGLEFIRGELILGGYPWLFVGHPLIDAPILSAPAVLGGAYLVSLLVAALSGAAADWWITRRRLLPIGTVVVVAGIVVLSAVVRPDLTGGRTLRVGVVQTNVPQDNKMVWTVPERLRDWNRFEEMTRQAAALKPDLIVWPETMFPGLALDPVSLEIERKANLIWHVKDALGVDYDLPTTAFADRLFEIQAELGVPMLVGAGAFDGLAIVKDGVENRIEFESRYNSAMLLVGGRVVQRYDKLYLTPFGEILPVVHWWPWLEHRVEAIGATGMQFDLTPGRKPVVLELEVPGKGQVGLATPICYESTNAGVCRRLVRGPAEARRGADVMVNLTNDGWFAGFDTAREIHLMLARWRCLELGVPMVRAANTGASALIAADGSVIRSGVDGTDERFRVDGVLVGEVSVGERGGSTIYARTGSVVGWSAAVLAMGMILSGVVRRGGGQRADRGGTTPPDEGTTGTSQEQAHG